MGWWLKNASSPNAQDIARWKRQTDLVYPTAKWIAIVSIPIAALGMVQLMILVKSPELRVGVLGWFLAFMWAAGKVWIDTIDPKKPSNLAELKEARRKGFRALGEIIAVMAMALFGAHALSAHYWPPIAALSLAFVSALCFSVMGRSKKNDWDLVAVALVLITAGVGFVIDLFLRSA